MPSFNKIVKSGLIWSGLAQVAIQLVKVGRWIVLLYFLSPEDFGLFAIAILVIGLPQAFIGESISSAIIQSKEKFTRGDLSTFHWLLNGYSVFLLILFSLFSSQIAAFFGEPDLVYLLIFLSISTFVEGFGTIASALLRKSLQFKFLAQVETFIFLLSTFLMFILAYSGFGVWALVGGIFLSYLLSAICYLYKSNFRPAVVFSSKSIRKIYIFSRDLALFRSLTYLMRYTDDFIIGYFFGKSTLGIYDRAYQIVHLPMRIIANRINSVLFPSYSTENITTESRREIHLKIIHYAGAFYAPLLGGILLFSESAVKIFLPEKWSQLSFFLVVLALGGIIHAFLNFNESIFLAKGKSNLQLKYGLITRGIIVFAYLVGAFWGVKGIALGYTIGSFIAFFPESKRAFQEIDSDLGEFWKAIQVTVVFFFFTSLITFFLMNFLEEDLIKLIIGLSFYTLCCGIYAMLFFRLKK